MPDQVPCKKALPRRSFFSRAFAVAAGIVGGSSLFAAALKKSSPNTSETRPITPSPNPTSVARTPKGRISHG